MKFNGERNSTRHRGLGNISEGKVRMNDKMRMKRMIIRKHTSPLLSTANPLKLEQLSTSTHLKERELKKEGKKKYNKLQYNTSEANEEATASKKNKQIALKYFMDIIAI